MKRKLSLITAIALSVTALNAAQFKSMGYKATSMGGASVANSLSSTATYNNPALLGKASHDVEVSLGLSSSVYDHGAGASYTHIDDTGVFDLMDDAMEDIQSLSPSDISTLQEGRDIILDMNGKGVEVGPQGYLAAQVYGFGFGVFLTSNVRVNAVVSQTHDQLIFEDEEGRGYSKITDDGDIELSNQTDYENESMQYAMDNGNTYGDAFGIAIAEIPIAYGHKFETSQGNVYVGASLKFMQAITYTEEVSFEDSDEEINDSEHDATSSSFGIDLGIAYEPSYVKNLTLGLVAKNLNSPSFEVVDRADAEIDPMVRMGVAYGILDNLEVAMDVDLTSNKTYFKGLESQMIGGGVNYEPASWVGLRAGLMSNLDSNDQAGLIYTAGLGLGIDVFEVDLSAQYSSESETVDGTSYPQYAKVELAFITRW